MLSIASSVLCSQLFSESTVYLFMAVLGLLCCVCFSPVSGAGTTLTAMCGLIAAGTSLAAEHRL